jgi:excinuclease UvrABC nuclease subunit
LVQAVVPIVELRELNFDHNANVDSFAKRIDNASIVKKLQDSVGIYAFFQEGGRLVYVGKAEMNNLFKEMEQRYWQKKVPFRVLKRAKQAE